MPTLELGQSTQVCPSEWSSEITDHVTSSTTKRQDYRDKILPQVDFITYQNFGIIVSAFGHSRLNQKESSTHSLLPNALYFPSHSDNPIICVSVPGIPRDTFPEAKVGKSRLET